MEALAAIGDGLATLYSLSKTGILNITGETSITKLNINFVLNYLAIEKGL